jgi:hypothetical protein
VGNNILHVLIGSVCSQSDSHQKLRESSDAELMIPKWKGKVHQTIVASG